jgi:hypothetical protein
MLDNLLAALGELLEVVDDHDHRAGFVHRASGLLSNRVERVVEPVDHGVGRVRDSTANLHTILWLGRLQHTHQATNDLSHRSNEIAVEVFEELLQLVFPHLSQDF